MLIIRNAFEDSFELSSPTTAHLDIKVGQIKRREQSTPDFLKLDYWICGLKSTRVHFKNPTAISP